MMVAQPPDSPLLTVYRVFFNRRMNSGRSLFHLISTLTIIRLTWHLGQVAIGWWHHHTRIKLLWPQSGFMYIRLHLTSKLIEKRSLGRPGGGAILEWILKEMVISVRNYWYQSNIEITGEPLRSLQWTFRHHKLQTYEWGTPVNFP